VPERGEWVVVPDIQKHWEFFVSRGERGGLFGKRCRESIPGDWEYYLQREQTS